MTPDPVVVTQDQSVTFATELLLLGDFHTLPVVNDNKLIGIFTSKDILEYMLDQ